MPAESPAPTQILIRLIAPLGPFSRPTARIPLPPTTLTLPDDASPPTLDPLRDATTGLDTPATLTATIAEHRVTLAGHLPARPARHLTTLRAGPLAIPVHIDVAAAHIWGIAPMLLGLLVVGTLGLLSGQTEVSARWRDAVQARQDVHNLLAAAAPPASLAADRATLDAEYAAAIAILGARPPVSIVDRRLVAAAPHLAAAEAAATRLRATLAGQPPGAAAVADLAAQWQAIQPLVESLQKPPPAPAPHPPPQTLPDYLDSALREYRARIVAAPAATLADAMQSTLTRARLDLAAGNGDLAEARARNQAAWLRRAATQLDGAITGARAWTQQAGAMLASDRAIRDALAQDALPATDAEPIRAALAQAASLLAAQPWPQAFADASHAINTARTALTAAESRASLARVKQQFVDADNRATDTTDIDALIATLQTTPHPTEAQKRTGLAQVLALWRAHIATVTDPPTEKSLTARLDNLDTIVARGKLADLAAPYRALGQAWVGWNTTLMQTGIAAANRPVCRIALADLQRDFARSAIALQEDPTLDPTGTLDRDRDRLDHAIRNLADPQTDPAAPDCLTALAQPQNQASALSGAILARQLADAAIADTARQRFAQEAGLATAPTTTRRLLLTPATPAEDVVAGNDIAFTLANADPVWGSSVALTIQFGDGAQLETDAESLRQGRARIHHRYRSPGTMALSVTARANDGPPVGAGHNSLAVTRSPITAIQALANLLTNIHFAIALILALVVYYWRFTTQDRVFGARTFDYVEAFALGFAASAATDTLPAVMTKLVSG